MFFEQKSQYTCSKIISGYATDFKNNAFIGGVLTDSFICGNALPFCPATATLDISAWITTYLADKPAALASNNFMDNLYNIVMSGGSRSSYTILHLSDLNIDYNYLVGSSNNCGDLVCCQAIHGTGADSSSTA
jgi:hypothetical protein